MANFFCDDASGQKRGPFSEQQLQTLATQGRITPSTPLESDTGHKGLAGQIPGLKFNTSASPPLQTAQATPQAGNVFCTNCGNSISEQAVACMSCGAKPIGHKKFCRQCGTALNPAQVICIRCGAGVSATAGGGDPKNKMVAALLAFFLGGLGIHWFYLGEKRKAISYLSLSIVGIVLSVIFIGFVFLLIVCILALVDVVKLLTMNEADFDMQYNT